METKAFVELKRADSCSFEAVIAEIAGEPDRDGDVLEPGSLDGQTVAVLVGHDHGSVSLGKARIEERGGQAIAVGQLNTEIQLARELCSWLEFDLANPPAIQEWSWAFTVNDSFIDDNGFRHLVDVDAFETSTVLRGAGLATSTLCAGNSCGKSAKSCCDSCSGGGECESSKTVDGPLPPMMVPLTREMYEELDPEVKRQRELAIRGIEALGGEPVEPAWRYKATPPEEWMEKAVVEAADRLRIPAPAVFQMRQCQGAENADIANDQPLDGAAMNYGDEGHAVFIREAIPLRLQMEYLGHELKHVEQAVKGRKPRTHNAVEYECSRYGFRFAEALAAAAPMPPR